MRAERSPEVPITSPYDPRLTPRDDAVAGADQIAEVLAMTQGERLRYLAEMLDFEERAHRGGPCPPRGEENLTDLAAALR